MSLICAIYDELLQTDFVLEIFDCASEVDWLHCCCFCCYYYLFYYYYCCCCAAINCTIIACNRFVVVNLEEPSPPPTPPHINRRLEKYVLYISVQLSSFLITMVFFHVLLKIQMEEICIIAHGKKESFKTLVNYTKINKVYYKIHKNVSLFIIHFQIKWKILLTTFLYINLDGFLIPDDLLTPTGQANTHTHTICIHNFLSGFSSILCSLTRGRRRRRTTDCVSFMVSFKMR